MITVKTISWLAGILEGEGCFRSTETVMIYLSMTDEDIIRRVAAIWKRPYYRNDLPNKIGDKTLYHITICGTPAIEWMMTVYSLMGYRRQGKIRELISEWKQTNTIRRDYFKCGHEKTPENTKDGNTYKGVTYKICYTCAKDRARNWARNRNLATV